MDGRIAVGPLTNLLDPRKRIKSTAAGNSPRKKVRVSKWRKLMPSALRVVVLRFGEGGARSGMGYSNWSARYNYGYLFLFLPIRREGDGWRGGETFARRETNWIEAGRRTRITACMRPACPVEAMYVFYVNAGFTSLYMWQNCIATRYSN